MGPGSLTIKSILRSLFSKISANDEAEFSSGLMVHHVWLGLTHWPLRDVTNFQTHIKDKYLEHFLWNCLQVSATTPHECYQMETFSVLLALCAGNSPVTSEFPSQRPVMQSFDVFYDLPMNKRLSKQLRHWWFVTPSCSLWHHCNVISDKSTLVQVMAWCHQTTSHYLNQCCWSYMMPYGITRPQWGR